MAIDTGGPAFPNEGGAGHLWNDKGMTLRDYFAGLALSHPYAFHDSDVAKAAEWAYQLADAMLIARSAG